MNAVEIEEALAELAAAPFDPAEFPFQFIQAFGHKDATIKRLRRGDSAVSDVGGGVLHRNHIHLAVAQPGRVHETLMALRASPRTASAKAKFILASDGQTMEAEDLASGEVHAGPFEQFADHFGFFLPLAGITTIKEIKDNPIDVRATGRLNKLYVELLKNNKEWAGEAKRSAMNHFMARLIFCFFAEDTDIFPGSGVFTQTMATVADRDGSNTHEVLEMIFRAMNMTREEKDQNRLPAWAKPFPYVNGGLFSGSTEVPRFTKTARSYLLRAGELRWKEINPDIFGSMIQAVADEDERGALGMHYTSVPNILKVLNPLFLDGLREQFEAAEENKVKLLNLRKRMSQIRVFDPACGSGNFLVIAYKQMREIEAKINALRGEKNRKSEIPISNFRGIELREFPAEIARLALIIAEFQCDVLHRGQQDALADVLPLDSVNWITNGNALQLDWVSVFPAEERVVRIAGHDLFSEGVAQPGVDFKTSGAETYICGNPPYRGSKWQTPSQKSDLASSWHKNSKIAKNLDLVTGWIAHLLDYIDQVPNAVGAFVTTNSICQGQQAIEVWPAVFDRNCEICFAYTPFIWSNLASKNAGVTVIIVGVSSSGYVPKKRLYDGDLVKECGVIGPYLIPDSIAYVEKAQKPLSEQAVMSFGNMPRDGGGFFLDFEDAHAVSRSDSAASPFIRSFLGSEELINGRQKFCLWIRDDEVDAALASPFIQSRLNGIAASRKKSPAASTKEFAKLPHRFVQIAGFARSSSIVVPRVSSERREYLPVGLVDSSYIIGDRNFAIYDAELWNFALLSSKLHLTWIAAVCGRLEMRFLYSNTLGWNTFPIPTLTEGGKKMLEEAAARILLAREVHYPATLGDLYDPEDMPNNLKAAHDANDEVIERIYIGRRFKNDTERLETLFDMYTKMSADQAPKKGKKK